MAKKVIHSKQAPASIGTYSQAIKVDKTVYLSGQIPLSAETMELVDGGFSDQARQVFNNLAAVAQAAGGSLEDAVKLTVYLTDLAKFTRVNEIMAEYFDQPYPARAAVEVKALPRAAEIEIDGVLYLD